MSIHDQHTDESQASARAWLMRETAPLRLAPPWSFIPPCEHIRGPIRTRTRTLAALHEQFGDETLLRAGLLEQHPGQGLRLASALTRRRSALLALQSRAEDPPFDLLAGGGLLSGNSHPVFRALDDDRTRQRAREHGVVVAAGHTTAVALMSALGLPATLGAGLHRLTLDEVRRLNEQYGEGLPQFVFEPEAGPGGISAEETAIPVGAAVEEHSAGSGGEPDGAGDVEIDFPPSPPALLLADWDPLGISAARQPWIRNAAVRLAEVRRSAGLPLGGVCVWRPHQGTLDRLRFAADSQDLELAQAALLDSFDAVTDIETLLADDRRTAPSTDSDRRCAAARLAARCHAPLECDELDSERDARESATAIEQELLAPLREYALTRPNPVVRNTVVLLADVAQLLFLLGPQVHDTLRRGLAGAMPPDSSRGTLSQYLSLVDRFGRLCGELRSWTN